jgi:hypothetical protein
MCPVSELVIRTRNGEESTHPGQTLGSADVWVPMNTLRYFDLQLRGLEGKESPDARSERLRFELGRDRLLAKVGADHLKRQPDHGPRDRRQQNASQPDLHDAARDRKSTGALVIVGLKRTNRLRIEATRDIDRCDRRIRLRRLTPCTAGFIDGPCNGAIDVRTVDSPLHAGKSQRRVGAAHMT